MHKKRGGEITRPQIWEKGKDTMNEKQQKRIDTILAELENLIPGFVSISEKIQNLEDELENSGSEKTADILYEAREMVDKIANISIDEVMKTLCKAQIEQEK